MKKWILLLLIGVVSGQEKEKPTVFVDTTDYRPSCKLLENGRWEFGPGGGLACWTVMQTMHDREASEIEKNWKAPPSETTDAMIRRQQNSQQHWNMHTAIDYVLAVLAQELGYRWSCQGIVGMGGAITIRP